MQSDEERRGYTGRAFCAFSPWNDERYTFSILQLYLGNNPLRQLEVVSLLNISNQAHFIYHFNQGFSAQNTILKYI